MRLILKMQHYNQLDTKIYRCYLIWDSNLYVVTGPAIVLVLATGKVEKHLV